ATKPGGSSVWYTWTPNADGIATLITAGSTFDTLLAVYTGDTVSNLTTVARDEDGGGFYTSAARFNTTAGQTVHFAIDGYNGSSGDFVLSWNLEVTSDSLPIITNQPVSLTVGPGETASFLVGAF